MANKQQRTGSNPNISEEAAVFGNLWQSSVGQHAVACGSEPGKPVQQGYQCVIEHRLIASGGHFPLESEPKVDANAKCSNNALIQFRT